MTWAVRVIVGFVAFALGGALVLRNHSARPAEPVDVETARPARTVAAPAPPAIVRLDEARSGFRTAVSYRPPNAEPLPEPPAPFTRSDYVSGSGTTLPAFVTADPRDGKRRPAIIWLTGGETNSLGDFWTPGPDSNDQSASAFRNAGVVMMFPVLRGGNGSAGGQEFFYGEVDDVLAAAGHLARLPYVNPARIYLGGHSTGGTLALLTAERSTPFAGVFAFGPVASVDRYPRSLIPVDLGPASGEEARLRSPRHWLEGLGVQTWIIEGRDGPGNAGDAESLCAATSNPLVHCILVPDADHFSVLARVSRVIAARLSVSDEIPFRMHASDFGAGTQP